MALLPNDCYHLVTCPEVVIIFDNQCTKYLGCVTLVCNKLQTWQQSGFFDVLAPPICAPDLLACSCGICISEEGYKSPLHCTHSEWRKRRFFRKSETTQEASFLWSSHLSLFLAFFKVLSCQCREVFWTLTNQFFVHIHPQLHNWIAIRINSRCCGLWRNRASWCRFRVEKRSEICKTWRLGIGLPDVMHGKCCYQLSRLVPIQKICVGDSDTDTVSNLFRHTWSIFIISKKFLLSTRYPNNGSNRLDRHSISILPSLANYNGIQKFHLPTFPIYESDYQVDSRNHWIRRRMTPSLRYFFHLWLMIIHSGFRTTSSWWLGAGRTRTGSSAGSSSLPSPWPASSSPPSSTWSSEGPATRYK